MGTWSIHLLNARGKLDGYVGRVTRALARAEADLRDVCHSVMVDIIVRAAEGPQPPEFAVLGWSFQAGKIELKLDIHNPNLGAVLEPALRKTVFHEFHHVLRWDGPGYGETLGEALVSEGLAQHFVHQLEACAPEPWEIAVPRSRLKEYAPKAGASYDDSEYSHSEWFFGSGDLPNWLGYSLGHRLVGDYLRDHPESSPLLLACEPAASFRPYLAGIA
jgi:Predicted Zn-dependent protease (DUF2268)